MADEHVEFVPGRFGRSSPVPGLRVRELTDAALASVVARRGAAGAASHAALAHLGCALPDRPHATTGREVVFLWSGPSHWLAVTEPTEVDLEARLGAAFGDLASVFDQSDGRVLVEIDGPRVREVLAKGVSIDLDPRSFRTGDVASTAVAHLNLQLWHVDESPRYRVLVVRTYFESFWRWLLASAAEVGGEVLAPRRYRHVPPIT